MNNFLKAGLWFFISSGGTFLVCCLPRLQFELGVPKSSTPLACQPVDADLGRIPGTLPANFQHRIERN